MKELIVWIVAIFIVFEGGQEFLKWQSERPYVLVRFTASKAIESTAQFQHKTKLLFEIGQTEAAIPGVCHNFKLSPKKAPIFAHYMQDGAMKFLPYRSQLPDSGPPSTGSLDLSISDDGFLTDDIDSCKTREVGPMTGAYELTLGKPVVNVNGIREEGKRAFVDFTWHFESLNEVGKSLPQIRSTYQMEIDQEHMTADEKSSAPFWTGRAELVKYDDGWRVVTIALSSRGFAWDGWEYGPNWPDPHFNWNAFDEDENH